MKYDCLLYPLLKGTVSHDFRLLFFCLKDSTWAPYEQAKTVCELFRFCEDILSPIFI